MSGYTDLRDLGVRFVPPDGPMPSGPTIYSPFSASWTTTVSLLARELRKLDAEGISIELDGPPTMFRQDGLPRSDRRANSPAVRITFSSKWGPLRYETCEYRDWQDNVRAIALSMEALRMVDRYGVSKRGEQYRGWRQLTMGSGDGVSHLIATPDQARAFLDRWDGDVRAAVKATHPDSGGDEVEFRKVMRAKELLGL